MKSKQKWIQSKNETRAKMKPKQNGNWSKKETQTKNVVNLSNKKSKQKWNQNKMKTEAKKNQYKMKPKK